MSLALLTRGYICLPTKVPPDVEIGPGPTIVDVDDLAPEVDRIKIEGEDEGD